MFAAGSIKSSKWGWDTKNYTVKYDASYAEGGGTVGCWSPLTLAPNGFYYALPRVWTKNSLSTGTPANEVLCFKPGKSNNKTNKWESGQVFLIPGNGGKQPALPSANAIYSPVYQNRFPSKGVLSNGVISNTVNGFIYFFGWQEPYYIRLKPQLNPTSNPVAATEWEVIAYNSTTPTINSAYGAYSGGVLGQDGHIYLIPCPLNTSASSRQKVIRIKPRNTLLNNTNLDVIEAGYYDGSTAAKSFSYSAYKPGVDINGTALSLPSDTNWAADDAYAGLSLSNAIVHPNGKIYLFGGTSKRIYILDPTKWGTSSEIYTSNDLYFPNILTSNPAYGWYGQGFSATLEKLRPGQDPDTLKIIFGWGGVAGSITNSTNKVYTASIVFDPVTETFDASNYNSTTNEGLTILSVTSGPAASNVSSSMINLPNGHIFQSTVNNIGATDGLRNLYGKLIYFNEDQLKYMGPQKRNILSFTENKAIFNTYTNTAGNMGWASSTPGIASSLGKTLYSSINGAMEITSVKGFYPRIKHFSYDDNQNYSFNSNPNTYVGVTFLTNLSNQIRIRNRDLTSEFAVGKKLVISNSTSNNGVYTIASLAYVDGLNIIGVSEDIPTEGFEPTAVLSYGRLIEFLFGGDTLRIYGVDLSNSMYNVETVTVSDSPISGNNGVKTRYDYQNIPPSYDETGNYSEIIFAPGTFTQSGLSAAKLSFQYVFNDSDVYNIPSDLSTLPTSLWNAYFNKSR